MFCAVTEEAQLEGVNEGTVVVDSHGVIHQKHSTMWWNECGYGLSPSPEVKYPALIIAYGDDLDRELEKLNRSNK